MTISGLGPHGERAAPPERVSLLPDDRAAAKAAGHEDIAPAMRDIGFQIAGWASMDKATENMDAPGMKLALGEIGNNLRVTVPVTFAEAVLGATIQVPTLGGEPVKLKVAPGTPNGRVLRVKGRGVVTAKAEGDLLATVDIAVPSHVSEKAKKALEDFNGLLPEEDPRADLLSRAGLL